VPAWPGASLPFGPFHPAGTDVRGNVLGNVPIYAVIFLIMLAPLAQQRVQERPK